MESSEEAKLIEREEREEGKEEEGNSLPVEEEKKKMKIVFGFDESEGSFHALSWTIETLFGHGQNPDFGTLLIVHAIQPFQQYFFPAGPGVYVTPVVIQSVKQAQEQNSARLLGRALALCNEKHVTAETMTIEGDAKEMICQVVEQVHADLVIVGSRGLGTIKRTLLGSVSDYVAHHAKCPVMIVKPPK
ncbi:uncharacterized protein LOC116247767 [Nymphaea colorata]|nr:uncharacterized protein LOC116247767 [Nymphaea colorata]